MSKVSVDIDGWEPDEVTNYDDDEFLEAERNFTKALQRYIDAGARPDNLSETLENYLNDAA